MRKHFLAGLIGVAATARKLSLHESQLYGWRKKQQQALFGRRSCEAKQCYGAPHLADELPEYNVKTIAASLHRQRLRARLACDALKMALCDALKMALCDA